MARTCCDWPQPIRILSAAAYPKKGINWNKVVEAVKAGIPAEQLNDYASDGYVINGLTTERPIDLNLPYEVEHVGSGFMMIKRRVFEKLEPIVQRFKIDQSDEDWTQEYFDTSIEARREVLLSEDYGFCDLWRRYGDHNHNGEDHRYPDGQVFLDLRIRLTHVGMHTFTGAGVVHVP